MLASNAPNLPSKEDDLLPLMVGERALVDSLVVYKPWNTSGLRFVFAKQPSDLTDLGPFCKNKPQTRRIKYTKKTSKTGNFIRFK